MSVTSHCLLLASRATAFEVLIGYWYLEDKDRLVAMRKECGMKQKEFAEYFGIPVRTLQDWERGVRHMPDYLLRLMIYKLEIEKLIEKKTENDKQD